MLKLIKCELYKGYAQLKMKIFLLIMVIVPFLAVLGLKVMQNNPDFKNNPELLDTITYSSFEFPLSFLGGMSDFLIPVFIIVMIVSTFTEEYTKGTLKLPVISPVSRGKVLLAKLIVVFIQTFTILSTLFVFSHLAGLLFFENSEVVEYGLKTMTRSEAFSYSVLSFIITALVLSSFACVVLILAIVLDHPSIVIGLSVGFILFMQIVAVIGETFAKLTLGTYFRYYNVFFTDYKLEDLVEPAIVVTVYALLGLVASFVLFKKKDLVY